MPKRETILKNRLVKPFLHWFAEPRIWHFNRRSVSGGIAVGIFVGFLPIPFQMALASCFALLFQVNLPLALLFTWVSNPFTFPIVFGFGYYVGSIITGTKAIVPESMFTLQGVLNLGSDILVPLFLGSFLSGIFFSLLSLVIVRFWWRFNVVKEYKARRIRKIEDKNTSP